MRQVQPWREAKGDSEISFVLAPGCSLGFRCRMVARGRLVASLGVGYFSTEKPLDQPAFYADLYEERGPVVCKEQVPIQTDNPKLVASPVALRITRKGAVAELSCDHDLDGNFTVVHELEVGAEAPVMFGIDAFEDKQNSEEFLMHKITIERLTRNE